MIRGKITYIIFLAIVSTMIISGCVSQQPAVTPAPTPAATPAATPVTTQQPGTGVEILIAPDTAVPGKSFDVTWRVSSSVEKNIPHTAVHYGPQSKTEPLTITSYPEKSEVMTGKIPADFSTRIIINTTGVIYFRAHAIIDGIDYWSSEKMITVSAPPAITVTSIPGRVTEYTNYVIKWQVSGGITGEISKTDIIWDFKKGNATATDYSRNTTSMTGKTPFEFSQTLMAPQTSTIYFRAHAIVDGIEIFSDEKQITIYPQYTTGY